MEMKRKFFEHNNKLYWVKREIPSSYFKGGGDVEMKWVKEYRDYLVCDHVLMMGEVFLFCSEVSDTSMEEVNEEENIISDEV
tara:strand:- start:223 stop:468 length:246 start_codon:yes stop_codon:yes gene_type:complete